MSCSETRPLLQSAFDGELDLIRQVQVEEHLANCASCAVQMQGLRTLREALASPALYHRAPATLVNRVRPSPPPTPTRRKPRLPFPSRALAAAVLLVGGLSTIGLLLSRSGRGTDERLVDAVIASHVRSLQVDHLTDVLSSDRHTVKPWFLGNLDFAPSVPDLSSDGYPLSGGRLDYIGQRPVAAIVYRRRLHAINLLVWPDEEADMQRPDRLSRQGFQIRHWRQAGMSCWAITDLNDAELDEFVRLFRSHTQEPSG